MEVMLMDWTSSANKSSVISSMMASMESVWLTTAVQMICVERTPSRNCLPSLARRVDSHATLMRPRRGRRGGAASRRRRRRNMNFGQIWKQTQSQHLLHAEGDVDEFEALGPLEAVLHDGLLDFCIEGFQVLVRLPGLDLEVT